VTSPGDETLVRVFVGNRSNGKPRFETLWVEGRPDGLYRLVRSPLMALGVARDDVFELDSEGTITAVVEPGGYTAVQLVSVEPFTDAMLGRLIDLARRLGGTMDAHDDVMAALSVPKSVQMAELNKAVAGYEAKYPVDGWWTGSLEPLVTRS